MTIIDDDDELYIIDANERTITCNKPTHVVQNDTESEMKTFKCPKIIEGRDITTCTEKRILIKNGSNYDAHDIDDMEAIDDKYVKFTWPIASGSTQNFGKLYFCVVFRDTKEDGTITYSWSTAIYKGLKVFEAINFDGGAISPYLDVLEQWKYILENGAAAAEAALEKANSWVDEAKTYSENAQTSAENSEQSYQGAKNSEENALIYSNNAKASADAAKVSETNAKTSEEVAQASEEKAKGYAEVAQASEEKATALVDSRFYIDDDGYICLDKEL